MDWNCFFFSTQFLTYRQSYINAFMSIFLIKTIDNVCIRQDRLKCIFWEEKRIVICSSWNNYTWFLWNSHCVHKCILVWSSKYYLRRNAKCKSPKFIHHTLYAHLLTALWKPTFLILQKKIIHKLPRLFSN